MSSVNTYGSISTMLRPKTQQYINLCIVKIILQLSSCSAFEPDNSFDFDQASKKMETIDRQLEKQSYYILRDYQRMEGELFQRLWTKDSNVAKAILVS